jgi:integrase
MEMGKWLTDSVVRDLKLPERGIKRVYDAPDPRGKMGWASGFGVRVSSGGSKSFVLLYRSRKTRTEHLYTIGSFPDWSVTAARAEARELKQKIDKGADPQAEKKAERDAATVADLCDKFLAEYLPKKRANTQRDYTGIVEKIVRPALGRKLVAAVDHSDIEKLHREITERAPHRANRTIAVISRMFTLGMRWRISASNPARGIERNPEGKRKRYLTGGELRRLTKALAEHEDQQAANVFRMLLLTGARKGEVLAAEWKQFDFGRNVWTKPAATTKQKTEHEVPLGSAALQLLEMMRKAAPRDARFVFPGHGSTGHLTEVKKNWAAICKAAGITGLRMHDLRHSYASFLASAGFSLPTIGALLGHTQPNTTARYAHLLDDPLREATNRVGALMTGLVAAKQQPPSKRKLKVVAGGGR